MMVTIIATVVLLGLLVFVHELGHFLLAKLLGVKVERFSLGFPPKMIGRKVGETEYILSWIPLGGYVKMLGESPDEEPVPEEEEHRSFSHKPTWARFLIVFAGPGFNFFFAFLVYWMIFAVNGLPAMSTDIGRVAADMPAGAAGLVPGDRITVIDGRPVKYWDEMIGRVQESEGREIEVRLRRDGREITARLRPRLVTETDVLGDEHQRYSLGLEPYLSASVSAVQPGMPAAEAGMKAGDRIVALNGRPVRDWRDVLDGVGGSRGRELEVTVSREGQEITFRLRPREITVKDALGRETSVFRIGIERQISPLVKEINPIEAIYHGALYTWQVCSLTIRSVAKLIGRKLSVKTLGGPIFIAQLAGQQAKAGLVNLILLAALLSLNLGILNLLPIPVLDGGHLFFFILEFLFRRPISMSVRERAQQAGLVFLILFMAFVFYNDLARIFTAPDAPEPKAVVEKNESPGPGHVDPGR